MGTRSFTLVELVIIIAILGILAGVATTVIGTAIDEQKFRATLKEMENLKKAIIGDPDLKSDGIRSDFGFVGDIGRFPNTLDELVIRGGLPVWSITTGIGWHGPYVETGIQENPDAFKEDAWGNPYVYSNTTGVITSYGFDGASGGSDYAADFSTEDLTSPADQRLGQITGRVIDVLGNPMPDTPTTDVRVRRYYPVNGVETYAEVQTDSEGKYADSINIGKRKIEPYVGGIPYPIKTAIIISDVEARLDFQISTDVTTPDAPSSLSSTAAVFSHINLEWTAPVQNTDGTTLTDLAGYNIYRGSSSGFTPSASNRITTVGLVSEWTDSAVEARYVYYYIIGAVDNAGNESADSSEISNTIANGDYDIKQVSKATRWGQQYIVLGIQNFSGSGITVTQVNVAWTGGEATQYSGGSQKQIRTRIPSSGSGWITNGHQARDNGVDAPLNQNSMVLDAYGNPNSEGLFRVGFDVSNMPEGAAITIQFNPQSSGPTFVVY